MKKLLNSEIVFCMVGGAGWLYLVQVLIAYIKKIPDWDTFFVFQPHPILTPFFGAIIGGLLTLGGVAWTIDYYQKKHIEDMRFKIMPHLIIEEELSDDNIDMTKLEITANSFTIVENVIEITDAQGQLPPTKLLNLGFGPAYIYKQSVTFLGKEYEADSNQFNKTYLPHNSDIPFSFFVTISDNLNDETYENSFGVVFYYNDVNNNHYRQRIDILYDRSKSGINFDNIYTYHQPELLDTQND